MGLGSDRHVNPAKEPPRQRLLRPADHGRWSGDVFYFKAPVLINGELTDHLDLSNTLLPEGLTPDDVVSAVLNPVSQEDLMAYENAELEL